MLLILVFTDSILIKTRNYYYVMITGFYEIFLAGKHVLSLVGLKTVSSKTMRVPLTLHDNSRGLIWKSTVIDTFLHVYQRVAILAALDTELALGIVCFK